MAWWIPLVMMGASSLAQSLVSEKSEEAKKRLAEIELEMSDLGLAQYWDTVKAGQPLEEAYRGIMESPQYQTASIQSDMMTTNQNYGLSKEQQTEQAAKYGLTGSGGFAQDMGNMEGNRWLAGLQAKQGASDKQFGLQQTYASLGRGLPSQAASGLSGAANTGFGLYSNLLNQEQQQKQGISDMANAFTQLGSDAGWF